MKEVKLQVADPARYDFRDALQNYWIAKGVSNNIYSYSATVPPSFNEEQIKDYIRRDLGRWLELILGISVKLDTIPMPTLLLGSKGQTTAFRTGTDINYNIEITGKDIRFINCRLPDLINYFNATDAKFYMVNETGVNNEARADFELPVSTHTNVAELKDALKKYGLDLVETTRPRPVYVITETGFSKKH
jgi:hypothetical protein